MIRALCFLIVMGVSALTAQAQNILQYYSTIYIDPASGEIYAQAVSQVQVPYYDPLVDTETAGAVVQVSSATDSCGNGCAVASGYGQVTSLGTDYVTTGAESGSIYFADGSSWFEYETSSADGYAPSGPTIYLNSIDASDPHNVRWNYQTVGNCPNSLNWQLGDYLQINTTCGYGQFIVDQFSYPSGYNYAQITAHMYGVTVFGTGPALDSGVNRVDNMPITAEDSAPTYDGNGEASAPELISVTHIATIYETYFQYGCGVENYGGLTTAVWSAMGGINTAADPPSTNREMDGPSSINENFAHQGIVEQLGYDFASSSLFQIRQHNYSPMWWPSYQAVTICNTVLWLGDYFAVPLSCIPLTVI